MIYILLESAPYEGETIKGVFNLPGDAEKAKQAAILEDDSNGYNDFYVEPWELK